MEPAPTCFMLGESLSMQTRLLFSSCGWSLKGFLFGWKGRQSPVVGGGVRLWQTHPLYYKCNHHLIQGLKPGDINTPFYIYICTHTLTDTEIYTRIHVHTNTHIYRYTQTEKHTRVYMYTHAHMQAWYTCTRHMNPHTYKHTHASHTEDIHACKHL